MVLVNVNDIQRLGGSVNHWALFLAFHDYEVCFALLVSVP
jgi:hypothetical protein